MMLCIHWSPEMGVWTVCYPSGKRRVITQEDIAGTLAHLAPVFVAAKDAVESGRAIAGVHIEI